MAQWQEISGWGNPTWFMRMRIRWKALENEVKIPESMALLQASEVPPRPGEVTVGEVECRFLVRDMDEEPQFAAALTAIPDMYVDAVSSFPDDARDPAHHFLPVSEHWLKRFLNTWRDEGVFPALEGVTSNPDLDGSSVKAVASWVVAARRWAGSTVNHLSSHKSTLTAQEVVARLSPIPDWDNSPVRAMDLHPRLPYIALARQDDAIEIRELSGMEPGIVLRDRDQTTITCLQWAPHANSLLAVGAKVGVLLWCVDPTQPVSRFLTSWVRLETSPGHVPVTTISWSPCANYLVSGSPLDTNLVVWDVPMGLATRVCRTEGGGVTLVAMAPRGGRVLAASAGGVMRVWESGNWTCEKWSNASDARCQAACWSPAGDFLLFALHGDPALYYLSFRGNSTAGSVSAVKCADLSPCAHHVDDGQEPILVGGAVQSMCWDDKGERLAIIFTEESPGHNLVAVLRTKISTVVEVLPGGFVRGEGDDIPQLMSFQRNCYHGALLATAWLSGRVSFTPFLFTNLPSSSLPSFPLPPSLHQPQLYSTYIQQT